MYSLRCLCTPQGHSRQNKPLKIPLRKRIRPKYVLHGTFKLLKSSVVPCAVYHNLNIPSCSQWYNQSTSDAPRGAIAKFVDIGRKNTKHSQLAQLLCTQ